MFKKVAISLFPFLLLLLFSIIACFIGYWIFIAIDGRVELSRVISKIAQLLLILSIYPVMRWLDISVADLGFVPFKDFLKQMAGGMVLGLFTLLPVLLLSYALGITNINTNYIWTLDKLLVSLLVTFLLALLISLLEEPMFRGILIAAYVKRLGITATILVSSLYYALLHFIKTKTSIAVDKVVFWDSFRLLSEAFENVLNPENYGALWALLMVGVFLAIMRTRLQLSLAWCIGCHAAWVWQIKMAHKVTDVNQSSDLVYLVSPYDGVIGPMVAIWLTLVLFVYFGYQHCKKSFRGVG